MVDQLKAQEEKISRVADRGNGEPKWRGYAIALLGAGVALVWRLAIQPWLPAGIPFGTFYIAPALAAWLGGRGPGLFASALGYLAGEYFLTPPYNTPKLIGSEAGDVAEAVIYFCVSVTITLLFARLRDTRRQTEALNRIGELKQGLLDQELCRRRGTEEALREGKLRYRRVMDTTHEGVWAIDARGKTNHVNSRLTEILGYTSEEMLGRPPEDFLFPEDAPQLFARLEDHKEGTPVEGGCRARHKDGRAVYLDARGLAIIGDEGEYLGAFAMFADLTGLRKTEQALLEKEQLLRVSVDAASLGTWIWDSGRDVGVWNDRMYEMFEISKDGPEQVSLGWNRVDSEDLLEFQRRVRDSLENGRLEHEFRVQLPIGGRRWFRTIGHAISPGPGEAPGLAGVTMDITQRKLAEESLLEKQCLVRAATTGARLGTWLLDVDRDSGSWNDRMYEMLEVPRGAANYMEIGWSRIGREDLSEIKQRITSSLESGRLEYEYRVNLPLAGTRWHRLSGCVIPHSGPEVSRIAGVTMDITEEKCAEAALREAMERLGKTKEMLEEQVTARTAQLQNTISELEAFSYSLSHDMRAPLRTIYSFTKHVLTEYGSKIGSSGTEFLERIVTASNRMDQLIQEVLSFSRLSRQEIKVALVDVDRLVGDIILERAELQPPKAEITILHPLLPMRGHEASLTQCLTNLLGNAVKFVARGVEPKVRVWTELIKPTQTGRAAPGTVADGEPVVAASAAVSGPFVQGHVRLWIRDNGIGIKQEDQGRIFALFHRLHSKEQYEGTGLGLAIVRKAVERMGGEVGVQSEPGKGSRFWLQLPLGLADSETIPMAQVHQGHAESWSLAHAAAAARPGQGAGRAEMESQPQNGIGNAPRR